MYHNKLLATLLVLSAALCMCNGAAVFPRSLTTQSGTVSDVSLSALRTRDQSGNQDTWNNYVEFYGSRTAYKGVFTFDVSGITSVGTYTLDVNFKGPKKSAQEWSFEYYVPSSDSWVFAGDNANAASWSWTALSFTGSQAFSTLVQGNTVQVRLSARSRGDDCDLDYLALNLVTSNVPATAAPSTAPTSAPTTAPTTKPTSAPSTAPTTRPTSAPTTRPTSAPTTRPTSAPTTRPTSAPTNAPTTRPTNAPTTKPTNPPTTGGRICPAGQIWSPAPLTTWQWQLTGTIDQSLNVQMYDIDLFDATASLISSLHSRGRVVICYFSTQYEDWRPDASSFPSSVLGSNLDDWPGERYVDIRSSVVRNILAARLDLAVTKGCDGVEPDNVDSYANSNGLGLTAANQIDFNRFLASEAHRRGLSIGLKNDLDQVNSLVSYFDWALNEQCHEYGECSMLDPFVTAGKAVFGVEYEGSASSVCPSMVSDKFSWLMKDLDLGAAGTQCCTYAPGGCAAQATYRCVTAASKRALYEEPVADFVADDLTVEAKEEEEEAGDAADVAPVDALVDEVIVSADDADHSSASFVAFPAVALVVASAIALVF